MLKIVRSNCNSIPTDISANSPKWLQDIQRKLADPLNASSRVYRIVPTSRRRKFLTRYLAQSARIIPQIITLDQWINELSAQGMMENKSIMSETQRLLILAKAWYEVTKKESGPGFLTELDRIFRDFLATQSLPDSEKDSHIFKCFEKYKEFLQQENLVDRNTFVAYLHDALVKNQGPTNWLKTQKPCFIFEGFHLFSPLELNLILQVAKHADLTLWMVGHLDTIPGRNAQKLLDNLTELDAKFTTDDYLPPIQDSEKNKFAALGNQLFQETGIIHPMIFPDGFKVVKCHIALEEVEAVARWLKSYAKTKGAAFRKVTVVIPGEPYGSLVREIFSSAGIPFNLAGKGFDLVQSRPVRVLHAALDLIQNSWTKEDLSGFLHLPFVLKTLTRSYFVEELLRIPVPSPCSLNLWREAIKKLIESKKSPHKEKFIAFVNSLETILQPIEQLEMELGKGDIHKVVQGLFAIFKPLQMPRYLSARYNINDASPIVPWLEIEKDQKAFIKLGDIFRDLLLQNEKWLPASITSSLSTTSRAKGTLQLLNTILLDRSYQVVNDDDAGVQVFETREIQGLKFESVFALGLVSGTFPTVKSKTYLARVRENHPDLSKWMASKRIEEKYLFTRIFEAATENLILSFPIHDEGRELIPSLFIKPFEAHFSTPVLEPAIICKSEKDAEFGRNYRNNQMTYSGSDVNFVEVAHWFKLRTLEASGVVMPKGLTSILNRTYSADKAFSPTLLESYSACPFRFFAEKIMRLLPFEDNESTLLGKLVHKALFNVYSQKRIELKLGTNEPLPALNADSDRELLVTECKNIWTNTNYEFAGMIPENRLNLLVIEDGVIDMLLDWMQTYEVTFGFLVGEKSFEKIKLGKDSNGIDVFIEGRADRIDANRLSTNELAVIDFKTGKPHGKKIGIKIKDGRLLQLPLYALTTQSAFGNEVKVTTAKYLHLADSEAKTPESVPKKYQGFAESNGANSFEIMVKLTVENIDLAKKKALENVTNIRGGVFPLSMHQASTESECTSYCKFGMACRQPAGIKKSFF